MNTNVKEKTFKKEQNDIFVLFETHINLTFIINIGLTMMSCRKRNVYISRCLLQKVKSTSNIGNVLQGNINMLKYICNNYANGSFFV